MTFGVDDPAFVGGLMTVLVLICLVARMPAGLSFLACGILGLMLVAGTGPATHMPYQNFSVLSGYFFLILPFMALIGHSVERAWRFGARSGAGAGATAGAMSFMGAVTAGARFGTAGRAEAIRELVNAGMSETDARRSVRLALAAGIVLPGGALGMSAAIVAEFSAFELMLLLLIPGLALVIMAIATDAAMGQGQQGGAGVGAALIALIVPILICVVGLSGWFTPVEIAAAIAVFAVMIGAMASGDFGAALGDIFCAAVTTSGALLWTLAGFGVFAAMLNFAGLPALVVSIAFETSYSPMEILLVIVALLLILGMLIEPLPLLALALALFAPFILETGMELGIGVTVLVLGVAAGRALSIEEGGLGEAIRHGWPLTMVAFWMIALCLYQPHLMTVFVDMLFY